MYYGFRRAMAAFEEDFLAGLGAGDTAKQAEYRACLLKFKGAVKSGTPACAKPVRRAKEICGEVGGTWQNKKCVFTAPASAPAPATAAPAATVDSDTARQADYRQCLLRQKAGGPSCWAKPQRRAKQICDEVGGVWQNNNCAFPAAAPVPVPAPTPAPAAPVVDTDTKKQAAYRACLMAAAAAGGTPSCAKPARKAKDICQSVGGTWQNRKCSFPSAAPAPAPVSTPAPVVDTDTKKQAAYRACLVAAASAGVGIPSCTKPARKAKDICQSVGGTWQNRKCVFGPVPSTSPAPVDTDTKKQAAYRACLVAAASAGVGTSSCVKPARKAKDICAEVGGTWQNRKCTFGAPSVQEQVVAEEIAGTKRQQEYYACLLRQKAGESITCKKPVRKAKQICAQVGGVWANRACTFPSAQPVITPDQPVDTGDTGMPDDAALVCADGYQVDGDRCIPVGGSPGAGYELVQYGNGPYWTWKYTGGGVTRQLTCASGWKVDGDRCIPVQGSPGAGYELVPYQGGPYWVWQYTGTGDVGGGGGSAPPVTDWGTTPPGSPVLGPIEDGYLESEAGDYYPEIGPAPAPLPPPLLTPIDETGLPVEMSAEAIMGLTECAPDFAQYLPMEYADQYGLMKVLQVFCGAATQQDGGQVGIESAEMYATGM